MTQLTSIANLRSSTAVQYRVDTVEAFLKKQNPAWQAEWAFPIAVINLSNGPADCTWVRDHTGTHIKPTEVVAIGGKIVTAEHIINNLKRLSVQSVEDLTKMNEAIVAAVGSSLSWTNGMVVQPQGGAVAPAPFEQSKTEPAPALTPKAKTTRSKKLPTATTGIVKTTRLDEAKKLFSELTPKQKVDLMVFAQEKVGASKACQDEVAKLGVSPTPSA